MSATPERTWLPRPYLFRLGSWSVPSYTVMLYVGCVVGVYAGAAVAAMNGLPARDVALASVVLIVPALIGSRLLYVAQHAATYRGDPARIWRRSEGGSALFGGLLLALVVSVPLLRVLDLPFLAFWDAGAVTMAVGNAFTRVGCHLTGCCAGRPTAGRFGVELPNRAGVRQRRVPTQLLEAAWAAVVVLAAIAVGRALDFDGAVFGTVIALYGAGRLVLERQRESDDSRQGSAVNLWVCATLIALGVTILAGGAGR
jgi:phosphatidylglycerol:prolipoprotein diacylglycerol transferase